VSGLIITARCAAVPSNWRDELTRMLGARPRRIGPWAELALYGALRCMADAGEATLPADAVLIMASRRGTHAATAQALAQMADDLPMPLAFLQTQPSQVLALLAQQLGWQGNAIFLAGADSSRAQSLAESLAVRGGALVGRVDDGGRQESEWLRLCRR